MQERERESSDNVKAIVFVETDCAFVRADYEVELDSFEASFTRSLQRVLDHSASHTLDDCLR